MKNIVLKLSFLIAFSTVITSCTKNCKSQIATCDEVPPTNELCEAYFKRWFYYKNSKDCIQIDYSGCSEKGFETKEECDKCKCD